MVKPYVLNEIDNLKATVDTNEQDIETKATGLQNQITALSNNALYSQKQLVGGNSTITNTSTTNYWFRIARIQNIASVTDTNNSASIQGRMDIQGYYGSIATKSYNIEFSFASRGGTIKPHLVFGGEAITDATQANRVEFKVWKDASGWHELWIKLPQYCKYASVLYMQTDCTEYWQQLAEPTGQTLVWHSETGSVQNMYLGKTGKVWTSDNDGNGSGLDADKLRNMTPASEATVSTIVQRDAAGQFKVTAPTDTNHVARKADLTKANVSLGSVENYGIATQTEAEAGSVDTKYMTPLKTSQAIASQVFNGKKYTSLLNLGNQDWTSLISIPGGYTATYSAADRGVVFNKVTAGAGGLNAIIRTRIPIDPNATYVGVARIKQLSGDGSTYIGTESMDTNLSNIRTDSETTYNYFLVKDVTLSVGALTTFRKTISGYNPVSPTASSPNKFDPEAAYFDIIIIPSYNNTISNSKLLIESLEIYKLTNATQDEAEAGTDNTVYMTPLNTKQAIDKYAVDKTISTAQTMKSDLILHDTTNQRSIIPRRTISTDVYGNGLYVDSSGNAILAHIKNGTETSALSITTAGLLNFKGNRVIDSTFKATQAQAEAGTDDTNYMTALRTKNAIDKFTVGTYSRYVMKTGTAAANQWAKLGTVTIANGETFSLVLGITSTGGAKQESNAIVSFIHKRDDSLTPKTYLEVDLFALNSLTNPGNLGLDSFKIIANNDTSSEIWINAKAAGVFYIQELVPTRSGSIAYIDSATWQASEPTGTTANSKTNGLNFAGNRVIDSTFKATQAQAEAGTDDTNYTTALSTKQAIDKFAVTKSGTSVINTGAIDLYGNSGSPFKLRASNIDAVFMEMYPRSAAQNTRGMWLGYGSAGSTTLTVANELTNANMNLATNGTGVVQANGNRVIDTTFKATQAQAEAGTDDTNYITALKAKQSTLATPFPTAYGTVTDASTLTKMSDLLPILFNNLHNGDVLHLKTISNIEYYNGASWVDWSTKLTEFQKILDGQYSSAPSIDQARFRFVIDTGVTYPYVHLWSVNQNMTNNMKSYTLAIESSTDKAAWTSRLAATTATGLGHTLFTLSSHTDSHRYYRLEFNVSGTVGAATTFGLSSIRGFTPRRSAILNGSGYPFSWNYSQVVDFKATPTVNTNAIYHAGNKPTKADVGLGNVDNLATFIGFQAPTVSGSSYSDGNTLFATSGSDTQGTYPLATHTVLTIKRGESRVTQLLANIGNTDANRGLWYRHHHVSNPNGWTPFTKIYDEFNKPSASDVGLGSTADTSFKSVTTTDFVKIGAMKLVYNAATKSIDFIHD